MPKFLSAFEKFLFGFSVFLFAFIPLYPKLPIIRLSKTFVAIRLEDFFIAFILGLWLLFIVISGKLKGCLKGLTFQTLGLFLFIGLVSCFSAIFVTHTVVPSLAILHLIRRVELMFLLPILVVVIKTKKQVMVVLATMVGVALLVDIYGIGQKYFRFPVISTTNSEFSKGLILYLTPGARVNSTFAGHYDLAIFMVMVLVMISALIFYFKKPLIRTILGFTALLSTLILVMTAARVSFVAALIGVIFVLLFLGKRVFVGLLILAAILALIYPSQLRDRFLSTFTINIKKTQTFMSQNKQQENRSKLNIQTLPAFQAQNWTSASHSATPSSKVAADIAPGEPTNTTQLGVYRSESIRFNVEWPRALRAFSKNPLLGTGYSSIELATDNDLLRSLGEVGILGSLGFVLFIVVIIKTLWKGFKSADKFIQYLSIGSLALVVAILVNGLAIDVFEASKVASLFWMFLGLNLGLINHEKS